MVKHIYIEPTEFNIKAESDEILLGISAAIKRNLFLGWTTYNPPKYIYKMKSEEDMTVPYVTHRDGTKIETLSSMFNRWLREGEDWQCIYDSIDRCKHGLGIWPEQIIIDEEFKDRWKEILYEYENEYLKF